MEMEISLESQIHFPALGDFKTIETLENSKLYYFRKQHYVL
jgi:hypothetical protein